MSPSQSLTPLPYHVAPSQKTLPDQPRSASRLNTYDDDNDNWENTLKPLPHDSVVSRAIAHSRESSLDKLQSGGLAGIPESPRSATAAASASSFSPGVRTPVSRPGIGTIIERVIDSKAAAYGHHRQTSIVHGIQHSRNGSLSSSSSPLSPQIIAAAGAGLLSERSDIPTMARQEVELSTGSRPPTALSGSTAIASVHAPDRTLPGPEGTNITSAQRKIERMHSKTRRDHTHHHSHSSRHPRDEQKTVGEYALHVLFTSVSSNSCSVYGPWHNMLTEPSLSHTLRRNSMTVLQIRSTPSPRSKRSVGLVLTRPLISSLSHLGTLRGQSLRH
jgi:hypothetical protein